MTARDATLSEDSSDAQDAADRWNALPRTTVSETPRMSEQEEAAIKHANENPKTTLFRSPVSATPFINACGTQTLYAGGEVCRGLRIMASGAVPDGEVHIRNQDGKLIGKIINVY